MDWKVFAATFFAVFAAELADKTQIVGIGMTAKSGKPLTVWAGSVAAYMLVTVISVAFGACAAHYLKPELIRVVGAVLFIVIGLLMLLKVL